MTKRKKVVAEAVLALPGLRGAANRSGSAMRCPYCEKWIGLDAFCLEEKRKRRKRK